MTSTTARVAAGAVIGLAAASISWVAITGDSDPASETASATTAENGAASNTTPTATPQPEPIERLGPVPELVDISGWLNTDADSFESVRGDVTIVQFWTFGCYNCKNTLPHLKAIYADHKDSGLEILGVHAHEFDFEADPDNIADAVVDLGVTWPVAIDATKVNFREWQPGTTSYWPRTFVIDQNGEIRFDHIGEGAYDELASTVARLLEDGPDAA